MKGSMSAERTRIVEEKMAKLFSEKKKFSEHLFKWEDDSLPDKYGHNSFEYTGQPTWEEFQKALDYQRSRGERSGEKEGRLRKEGLSGSAAGNL